MSWSWGGDFNMEPPEFAATGFEQEVGAVAMYPATLRGTFRAGGRSSMLDYFVISRRTAAAVHSVRVAEGTGVKGHVPVILTFKARTTALKALHIRRPPRMGTERVCGPIPVAPCWSEARAAAQAALQAARSGSGATQALLDDAYGAWADVAEQEVADYTGVCAPKNLVNVASCPTSFGGQLFRNVRPDCNGLSRRRRLGWGQMSLKFGG
jgi:hypothetical protein